MYIQLQIAESIKRITVICLLWIFCMFFYNLIIFFTADEILPGKIHFTEQIISGLILGFLFGLTNGFLEVFIFRQRFKRLRFGYTVILKTALFITAFITTVIIFILFKNNVLEHIGLLNEHGENEIAEFFGSSVVYKHGLYAVIFSFAINFILQIDNKMGKNVLFNLFFGRFHSPRKKVKIIMFLDLTSSTTIAEKIGDHKYSAFVKDFFYDLDEIIGNTRGAIYQYIGDEVVVLWNVKDGTDNNNCIRCYYESKKKINSKKERYNELYGILPQFKAGIHVGQVIVTEVGGSKSEIAYHGDAVNTASRLCAEAKNSENGLLISAELLSCLGQLDRSYSIESVGVIKFKGKKNNVAAFSVFEKFTRSNEVTENSDPILL